MNVITSDSRRRHGFLEQTIVDTEVVLKKITEANPNNTKIHRLAQRLLADLALFQVANVDSSGVHSLPNDALEGGALLLTVDDLEGGRTMLSSQSAYRFHDRQMTVMRRAFGDIADDYFQPAVRKKEDYPVPFEHVNSNGVTINGYGDIGVAGLLFQMQPAVILDSSLLNRGDYGKYVMTHELHHIEKYLSEPILDISRADDLSADMHRYTIGMEIGALRFEHEAYRVTGETQYNREIEKFIRGAVAYRRRTLPNIKPVIKFGDVAKIIVGAGSTLLGNDPEDQ